MPPCKALDFPRETQATHGPQGRILSNLNIWSPDSRFLVYDTRSDADGTVFDGTRIQIVDTLTRDVQTVYTSRNGACCGVATFHPHENRVVFILGPEHPTEDWQYGPAHRQGVFVDIARPDAAVNLDGRDLTPPFTPGYLRGGSHVHVYSPDGLWVSFTYNDAVLTRFEHAAPTNDIDQRNVGVSVCGLPPLLTRSRGVLGPREHSGTAFSVLVTRSAAHPVPGSDEIQRAFEEGWVGTEGYVRPDGTRQPRALAFLGEVLTRDGLPIVEVFLVDLPEDVTVPGDDGPLEGTETRRPAPPRGAAQRRLTYTASRRYPGVQGPRHWVRSSPDGNRLAFLMRDDEGIVQLWTVSPNGGDPEQVTRDPWSVASAFSWSPDGEQIAYVADNSVFVAEAASGISRRLTRRSDDEDAPLPLACVFSPGGNKIAYMRRVPDGPPADSPRSNQIFIVEVSGKACDNHNQ